MELVLQRIDNKPNSTYGILFERDVQQCFIIEDGKREIKIAGETRIPAGRYQIKYREVLSGMTKKYRAKYDYFEWHLELQKVPNFQYVYGHVGNRHSHTEGCLLFNTGVSCVSGDWVGSSSALAYDRMYPKIGIALDRGEEVWITIRDEDYMTTPF